MRETSIEAYREIKEVIPEKRKRVLKAIEVMGKHGATLFELVKYLNRPINEISGRVTELSKAGLIQDSGRRMNPSSGKASTVWTTTEHDADQ